MDYKKTDNSVSCPCTYTPCARKGLCCECVKYHRENNELPGCYFDTKAEKTYDRSVDFFIRSRKHSG